MKIEIPKTLSDLGVIFQNANSSLFLVGGYVRNSLLGFVETDMDICGPMRFDDVQKLLDGTLFEANVINQKLGTLLIKSKITNEEFEYTTWRKESYSSGGVHSPNQVSFVSDITQDAIRRDFTCNAIYYDINTDKIVDLHQGVQDTLAHILKTVNAPSITFDDDGLRILRLVRMSCELDFVIDQECGEVAKQKISQLADISQERFNKEIISILFSDYKYDAIKNPHSPTNGLNILSSWGAWGYIFRELSFSLGLNFVNEKLKTPWVKLLGISPAIHRISVFTYEILKALELEISSQNIEKILGQNGIMLSKKEVILQTKLLCGLEQIKNLNKEEEKRIFIVENSKYISRMLDLAEIFNSYSDLKTIYKLMLLDKAPLSLKELNISGKDLISNFPSIKKESYGDILNKILLLCANIPELNEKQKIINLIRGKIK